MSKKQIDEPKTAHFLPSQERWTDTVVVGQKFLASIFYSFDRDTPGNSDEEIRKRDFSHKFIQGIKDSELPFERIIVNQHTIDEAATHLKRNYSTGEAINCVQIVRSSDVFEIASVDSELFIEVCERFDSWSDQDGSFTDFVIGVQSELNNRRCIATWDSHYTPFDLELLPNCDWEN